MIQVMIIDDNKPIRDMIREELESHPDIRVVGEADDGLVGCQIAVSLRPDIVVMDMSLGRLDGISATKRLVAQVPDICIIGVSAFGDDQTEQTMLAAGAAAFVKKEVIAYTLVDCIRKVLASH